MIKKSITYENFDEKQVTEAFYFHLSQVELLRWEAELESTGGVGAYFEQVMNSGNGAKIMAFMEDLIARSYGEKSENGNQHLKSQEILNNFKNSAAYDTFFMSLVTNPESAAEFMNGIVPKELAANVERLSKLEQVKANVAKRQGTGDDALMIDEPTMPNDPGLPEETEISDPSQGGNVFTPKTPRTLTLAEMREMDHEELTSGLAEGRFVIPHPSER